jgi:hypothetical protein
MNKSTEKISEVKKDLFPEIDRFRRELRGYIDEKGLDDGEIARETGIAANTLSLFLTGKTQVPKMDFFLRLIHFTDFRPWFMSSRKKAAAPAEGEGLPEEVTDAIQKAAQMVDDFIEAIPEKKRKRDSRKKAAFIAILADLQASGQQEKIPGLLSEVLAHFRQ